MKPPLCYLNTAKGNAREMMEVFAAGSGAEITTNLELVPGREAVLWGVDRLTLPLWQEIVKTKTPYWYVDNGYFRSKWSGGDYYRITRNAEQCTGDGESDGARWRALGLKFQPWRKSGTHILIACQSDFWHERHGDGSAAEFARRVTKRLMQITSAFDVKRPIIVRGKPIGGHKEPPLAEQLADCWAVVTYSSMVATDALLAGVPAFVLAPGAAAPVTHSDLWEIERPLYPGGREHWAAVLADNQWRLGEIRDGTAWRMLHAGEKARA